MRNDAHDELDNIPSLTAGRDRDPRLERRPRAQPGLRDSAVLLGAAALQAARAALARPSAQRALAAMMRASSVRPISLGTTKAARIPMMTTTTTNIADHSRRGPGLTWHRANNRRVRRRPQRTGRPGKLEFPRRSRRAGQIT